ncbi:amidophosphoribosyltransferase [Spirochaeta thermophila DSM 6578]|uniref:Amidophosphoribosyltransferase n=1 Tax=Winmispira thermophila (strain ATCC 700085 / DSM 6578 / Z-1203) TaxID=869211 RepID=G0GFE2_WINT7|nr:amidophosphoribosyltransferase [Spirochaeta thermophila]AEJ61556.1 amidophosphoribosyltransferase [Spirochaeta thermophila DSM 6578]
MNPRDDHPHEECGVFGIRMEEGAAAPRLAYYGIYALQHRGQESAGIAMVRPDGSIGLHKGMGLVAEVFSEQTLAGLEGHAAIAHTRYSTTGSSTLENAQPLLAQSKLGTLAIAHNGNLVNAGVLRDLLEETGTVFHTTNDSEVILNLISRRARKGLETALTETLQVIQGSYAMVLLTPEYLIGVRDPRGIRPLCLGEIEGGYVLASESCSLDAVGARLVRDVEPGEILIIGKEGVRSIMSTERTFLSTCSFEYIYFSRPDSILDGTSVYLARKQAGRILFRESPVDADLVSGVPDSGIVAAEGWSEASGMPYAQTLIKNKYVGRSFIAPAQELRERTVHVKLNVLRPNVAGKRIVLIDDSIVRGTTSSRLVQMLREAGAREVHFRIASPPVRYPCYFGIDIPTRAELVAANKDLEEIRKMLGVDSLAYLSVEGLIEAIGGRHDYCTGCFTGMYPLSAAIERGKYVMEESPRTPQGR